MNKVIKMKKKGNWESYPFYKSKVERKIDLNEKASKVLEGLREEN